MGVLFCWGVSFLVNPTPLLSFLWGAGSLLGLLLFLQVFSGLFLCLGYSSTVELAFLSVLSLVLDNSWGWLVQFGHSVGATLFFILLYFHLFRALLLSAPSSSFTWVMGFILFSLSILVAFCGYTLPLGNMSLWAANVITSLVSVVPLIGFDTLFWVWGGFCVWSSTLKLFFVLHFLIPLLLFLGVVAHVFLLHKGGSSSNLGVSQRETIFSFHFYLVNDFFGFILVVVFIGFLCLLPSFFVDVEMYRSADTSASPLHIQPEWYFLFAYTVLRSIPSNGGGVILMAFCVGIFGILFFVFNRESVSTLFLVLALFFSFFLLSFLGSCSVEEPFLLGILVGVPLYFNSSGTSSTTLGLIGNSASKVFF